MADELHPVNVGGGTLVTTRVASPLRSYTGGNSIVEFKGAGDDWY